MNSQPHKITGIDTGHELLKLRMNISAYGMTPRSRATCTCWSFLRVRYMDMHVSCQDSRGLRPACALSQRPVICVAHWVASPL